MLGHNQQAVGYPGDRILNTVSCTEAGSLCRNEGRKEGEKNYFSYFVIIGLGITIDALVRKGRNVLIKITDTRMWRDINKDDVPGNIQEKSNAPEDWNDKNGRK